MTVADDRAKPASSNLAHTRTSAIYTIDAAAKAKHASSVRHDYILISHKYVSRLSTLQCIASLNKANGAKPLVYSFKSVALDILIRCDDHFTEGLRSPDWVPDWDHPLKQEFIRAMPAKSTTAGATALISDFVQQVSRAVKGGATAQRAFNRLLCLLTSHYDHVDTRGGDTPICTYLESAQAHPLTI